MAKKSQKQNRDLDFLYEVGSLRAIQRAWAQLFGGHRVANILEHAMRVALLALIISRREGKGDEGKILKMALLHDLSESRTIDRAHVHKPYAEEYEEKAIEDLFQNTSLDTMADEILAEYKERESIESKIVKDADNLDIDLELNELAERGSKVPAKQMQFRKQVRANKFYTQTARDMWDENQKTDPDHWQREANTWLSGKKHGR